jgi:hypothetical protein
MDKNKTAFPYMLAFPNGETEIQTGMTLRDYFANSALNGLMSSYHGSSALYSEISKNAKNMAKVSYELADEMLKQREL